MKVYCIIQVLGKSFKPWKDSEVTKEIFHIGAHICRIMALLLDTITLLPKSSFECCKANKLIHLEADFKTVQQKRRIYGVLLHFSQQIITSALFSMAGVKEREKMIKISLKNI